MLETLPTPAIPEWKFESPEDAISKIHRLVECEAPGEVLKAATREANSAFVRRRKPPMREMALRESLY
jgi:hypothetical protein